MAQVPLHPCSMIQRSLPTSHLLIEAEELTAFIRYRNLPSCLYSCLICRSRCLKPARCGCLAGARQFQYPQRIAAVLVPYKYAWAMQLPPIPKISPRCVRPTVRQSWTVQLRWLMWATVASAHNIGRIGRWSYSRTRRMLNSLGLPFYQQRV